MAPSLLTARINGMGSYLPEKILTNEELEKIVDTTDDWIFSRTGMKERRIAGNKEQTSSMGAAAAQKALVDAGIKADQVDLVIVATMTPDRLCPSSAAIVQNSIGATNAAAMDLQAACTGFLYALSVAKAFIESATYKTVLVIASEKMSPFVDYTDRSTCVLFGDGAAAAVVSCLGAGFKIGEISLGADGSLGELLTIPGGGSEKPATPESLASRDHYIKMEGREVFKHAVRRMASSVKECLQRAKLTEKEISWLIPHQANIRIMDAMAKQIDLEDEQVYKTVHKYGNTSASSIAIAIDELIHSHEIKAGENLLLVAFGGGLTWGAGILTRIEE